MPCGKKSGCAASRRSCLLPPPLRALDSSRADLDGDGKATPSEGMALDLLVDLIVKEGKGADYLANIAVAYYKSGASGRVDLSKILGRSVGGGAVAAVASTCDGCPTAGDKRFKRGNANCDAFLNIADSQFILNFLFVGGPSPIRFDAADVDDNGSIQVTDAVVLLAHLYQGGPKPPKPFEYLGLDPTEDGLESSCDLDVSRFKEFGVFEGDRDVDGVPGAEAIYIVENVALAPQVVGEPQPVYDIRIEGPADPAGTPPVAFYRFAQPATPGLPSEPIPKLLVVAENRVVYIIGTAKTVWALKDTDQNRIANQVRTFPLPAGLQIPVDAALAASENGECLITLHRGLLPTLERLVVSKDSDGDGFIDAGGQQVVPVGVAGLPRISGAMAIAVDASTARVFVCGTLKSDSTKAAVIFYEDTNGDKRVDAPAGAAYLTAPNAVVPPSTTADAFDGIVFVPATRSLLTLSHPPTEAGGGARIYCATDPADFYTAPNAPVLPQSLFKGGLSSSARFLDAFLLSTGQLRAQVVYGAFQVGEYEDSNQDCVSDQDSGIFDIADGALMEAADTNSFGGAGNTNGEGTSICRIQLYDNFDYQITQCDGWSTPCNTNGSTQLYRTLFAETTYPCVAFPATSDAVAGWIEPMPLITVKGDWFPPRTDLAAIRIDGETHWYFQKGGACCFYHCLVNATFTVKTDVYFDSAVPGNCNPLLEALVNETRPPSCLGADFDSRTFFTQFCSPQGGHLLPGEFRFGLRNSIHVSRQHQGIDACAGTQDSENAEIKTHIRVRCN